MAEAHEAHYDIGNGLIRCEMTWTNRIERSIKSDSRRELVMRTRRSRGFGRAGAGPKCLVFMSGLIHLGWTRTLHKGHSIRTVYTSGSRTGWMTDCLCRLCRRIGYPTFKAPQVRIASPISFG